MTRPNVTLEVYNVIIMQDPVQDGRISFISPELMLKADLKLPNVHFRKETAFIFL